MPAQGWVLLGLAAVTAAANWWAVDARARSPAGGPTEAPPQNSKRVEYVAKPATLVLLIGVALVLDPVDGWTQACFVVALVLCLAAMSCSCCRDRFVPGLAAFLAGHVAYVAGFWVRRVGVVAAPRPARGRVGGDLGGPTHRGGRAGEGTGQPRPARLAYIASSRPWSPPPSGPTVGLAIIGGCSSMPPTLSLSWNRFVRPLPAGVLT